MPPEIVENKPYNFKADIWSLGVILYEMCSLCAPFKAQNLPALALKIVKYILLIRGKYDPINKKYSKEIKNLIK